MATVTDVEVANASFPTVRQDLNDILEAIATNFSADAEPTTTYPNQWWYETDTNKLYIRNEANDAWIHVLTLDQATDVVSSVEGVSADKIEEGNSSVEVIDTGTGYIQINVDGSEAGRFDSSGNLLVGKTAGGSGTAGVQLEAGGRGGFTKDDGYVTFQNRLTSDGEISRFMKDGTTVGSIGVFGGDALYIGDSLGGGTGLRFDSGGADDILPCSGNGTTRDNAIDLGNSSARFKDAYLSGGVYVGGTGAANYLDDYEEGTWTPVLFGGGTAGTYELSSANGTYTKIGRLVYVNCSITLSSSITGGGSSYAALSGLPFNYDASEEAGLTGNLRTSGVNYNSSATQINVVRESGSDSDTVGFLETFANASAQYIQIGDFSASDSLNFTLIYHTAS